MGDIAIPQDRLIAVLERRLHAAVSELAMKDAAIEQLQADLAAARAAALNAQTPAPPGGSPA